jgi:glyoxylase-like metal-dependent hydrolase (beta-lactamase superfamily II)/rhodanese-related sulfurtransferase
MIFEQHYLACLSHASYLIGDERTKTAVVVDPQRDIERYLDSAKKHGLTIRHVFLTHFHADFVSGQLELRERTGAEIHLGAQGKADYAATPAHDGDVLDLGDVRLRVLETPGHTPESISILVYDLAKDAVTPYAVLTGDALFIGDVGRPDLLVSIGKTSRELASMLYDSLRDKLGTLPDSTLVYPAHGAGSACGKKMSKDTFSTLGVQKQTNWALQPQTRDQFVATLVGDLPAPPAYFAFDAALNRRERLTLDDALAIALKPLPLDEVLRFQKMGAVVLDTRDPDDYASEHLAGSTNIGLGGKYASWSGDLLRPDQPIVLIAAPGKERESAMRLGRIGFDRVVGYLDGGAAAFAARRDLVRSHARIDAAELQRRLAGPNPPLVVDVRALHEWNAGHIDGARNEPLPKLRELAASLPRDRELVMQCQSGYRSSIAASLLEQQGFTRLADLQGGWVAWQAAHASAGS